MQLANASAAEVLVDSTPRLIIDNRGSKGGDNWPGHYQKLNELGVTMLMLEEGDSFDVL